ncbi:lonely Cys domain-containing protein [Streptomyces scopuliridis]|uniref:lonely Cys domain-containing protein n=1 Tax=Streptomyces scopuliridis TaxID=452529 RepID=UPI0036A2D1B3
MALMPSEDLRNLMFVVVGEWFPLTNEDIAALRGQIMEATKGKVDILKGKVDDSVAFVGDALPGEVGKNFIDAMGVIRPELDKLTDGMSEASEGHRKTSMDVREAKWNLIAELIKLAAEIAVFTALAAITGGASATQIAVRKMIARVRMLVILHELANRIPFISAIPEAIEEALLTLGTRLALMRWAPEDLRPGGVNWKDVGIAGFFGWLTSTFANIFGAVVRKFTNGLNDFFDNWMKDPPDNKWGDDLGDNFVNRPGRNSWDDLPGRQGFDIRRHVVDEIGQAPSEGAAETLAEGLVNEIFYDGFKINPWTALGAAVSRQLDLGLVGAGQALGGALHNFFTFKSDLRTDNSAGPPGGGSGSTVGGANGDSAHGSESGEDRGTGHGLDGGLGGGLGVRLGNVGGDNSAFRTETGGLNGLNGLDGVNSLNGVNGLDGVNSLNGTEGPNGSGGRGALDGGNGLNGLDHSSSLNRADGLDELRRLNELNRLNQFDGLDQPQGLNQPHGLDTANNLGPRGPEASAGNLGGRVPTSSQPLPDTAYEGQRQPQPGGVHQNPDTDGVTEEVADPNRHEPQPQPQTATQQPQPETHTRPQPQPRTHSEPQPHNPSEVPSPALVDDTSRETDADASPDATVVDGRTDTVRNTTVDALRDQHGDAVRRLAGALDSVQELRGRVEASTGTSQDAALLEQALDDAARAEQELTWTEDRLRDLGVDPHTLPPDRDANVSPVVERDGGQRQWIAGQVMAEDLADGVQDLDLSGTVDIDGLSAAGITVPPELRAQWELGSAEVPLREAGLPPVDQTRLLMLEPGPWSPALDATAANTTRRLWQESYADFADSVPRLTDGDPAHTPSQAWTTATALVLPLEMHPALADSRYAVAPYRDAVRDVAALLVAGGGHDAATALADRLRNDLGLPPRGRDGAHRTADPTDLPVAVPTASVPPREVPPAPVPRPAALTSADTSTERPESTAPEPEPEPESVAPEPEPESVAPEPDPVVARAVPLVVTSSDTVVPTVPEAGPQPVAPVPPRTESGQPRVLLAPPTQPDVLLAPPARASTDPIRDWRRISARPNRLRSEALRAIDDAVSNLSPDSDLRDLRTVLEAVREWKSDKTTQSRRWDAVTRLESAVIDRIDRIQRLSAPSRPAPAVTVPSAHVAAQHPVEVDGYAPASGFEVELHRYRLVLPTGHTYDQYSDLVSLPGLLKITLDRAAGVPILELVTEPARGLTHGHPDGRAERADVLRAFHDVMNRLDNARPGSSLRTVFPAEAGYQVDVLAENLPVKVNEAGGARMLVRHTAAAPIARAVRFLELVAGRTQKEPGPAQVAYADLGSGLQFGTHVRKQFTSWLAENPDQGSDVRAWDHDELEGALALGYTQAAATVRGSFDRSRPPKDLAAVASRSSLAGIRRGLGPVPRAFLEDRARQLANEFKSTFDSPDLPDGTDVLEQLLPPREGQGARATVGQYLDNLLSENPERSVDQHEALLVRTSSSDLDGNPETESGAPRLDPPVVVLDVRAYAPTESTPATVASDFDDMAVFSLHLYQRARTQRGLPKVGRPIGEGDQRPPVGPKRTDTTFSVASQGSMTGLTPEGAQRLKFLRDKSELLYRITKIHRLATDSDFRKGINDFLANIERDLKAGTPTPVDHDAIKAIMKGLHQKGVYGNKIQYEWYHRHQDKPGFEEAVEDHANESANHAHLWSKLGSFEPIQQASVGHGVVLEDSVQGRLFDGLLWGLSTWSSSPALGELWEQLSKSYVEAVTGRATVHVLDGTTESSVLYRIEWPTIRAQIEEGKVDGLNIIVYRAVLDKETGRQILVPVDTFQVRTQEEFDRLPKAPDSAAWFEMQTQVNKQQGEERDKWFSRADKLYEVDSYVSTSADLADLNGTLFLRPSLTPHNTFRDSISSSPLADLASRLPDLQADDRADLLASLSPPDREALSTNEAFVNSLRARLSQEDFAATAAQLMVVESGAADLLTPARQEAETIVASMLVDPDVTASLLTGGQRVVVVPRDQELTSLSEFSELAGVGVDSDGRPLEGNGRDLDIQRALSTDNLIAVSEENLLGEPVDVEEIELPPHGYSFLRHELAHAIEEVLSPADRALIDDHYAAKTAAKDTTLWPDGRGANYSASSAREYFAQLTNTYLAANTGNDFATGMARNNGADWVRDNDPALLPLLERLYGPGRAGILGSQDNPYILSGFRALFDRAERGQLTEPETPEPSTELPSPGPAPETEPAGQEARTGPPPNTRVLLAPPTQGGRSRRLVEAMRQMLGPDIQRHRDFNALYDALALLHQLHESDRRNAGHSMDLGVMAERVLHLPFDSEITPDHYRDLLLTAGSAARRGWASSIASIAAYQTHRTTGVLRPDTWMSDPYRRYTARDWSASGGFHLDVEQVWAPDRDRTGGLVGSPALWGHRPHMVMAERDAASDLIIVRDAVGTTRYVDDEEFAALVALDPDRPPNAHVVVLVQPPQNTAPETMPRLLADLAQVRVWSTDGQLRLSPAAGPGNVRLITLVDRRPGQHVGIWFPSDPGLSPRSPGHQVRTNVGTVLDMSDLESYPLTTQDGQSLTGRAYLTSEDLVRMEAALREASAVTHYANYEEGLPGVTTSRYGPTMRLPRGLEDSYVLVMHGVRGEASVTSRSSGDLYTLPHGELGQILRRRPSLRRMDAGLPIFAIACELARLRPGADRLVDPPEIQDVATANMRTVYATDAQAAIVPDIVPDRGDPPPILVLVDDIDRPRHGIWVFRQEPDADTLREIADVAGLPPDLAMRSTRALRWVRALREVFDIYIDTDPSRRRQFTTLIRDFGQLEMQRLALGTGPDATGPLTWRTLTQITGDFARRAGFSDAVVTQNLLQDVLRAARHRTLRLPGMPNLPNILFAPPTQAARTRPSAESASPERDGGVMFGGSGHTPAPRGDGEPGPPPALPPAVESPPVRIVTSSSAPDNAPLAASTETGLDLSPEPPAVLAPGEASPGPSDMDVDSPRPASPSAPAPALSDAEDTYHRTLVDAFGAQVTSEQVYPQMLVGVERLDGLRRMSADPALRDGPLDLVAVARQVLFLAPGTPVSSGHYGDLFRIALDPAVEHATGLAKLAAYGLVVRGALSKAGELVAPDGTAYGRNWSPTRPGRGQVLDLDTMSTRVVDADGREQEIDPGPSQWRPRPGEPRPFVLIAAGNSRAITVRLGDGTEIEVAQDVLTELLAMDPVLSGLSRNVPVLLLVPYAGEHGLELPRGLADGLGRQVWSSSGNVHLSPRSDGKRIAIALLQEADGPEGPDGRPGPTGPGSPKGHRGDWIPSRPGEVSTDDGTDVPEWERRLVSFTIVSDEDGHPQLGRAVLDADDLARREPQARNVHRMNTLIRTHPGSFGSFPPVPIPGGASPGEKVHHLVLHNLPEGFAMAQEDGSTYYANVAETTRWLRRRPSVQRLGPRDWIYAEACWAGRPYDGPWPSPATNVAAVLPPVADPLEDHPQLQHISTGLQLRMRGPDRPVALTGRTPTRPGLALQTLTDARGNGGLIRDVWPEPPSAELARRARVAGLHTGPLPVPQETLDRTLRLVHALRQGFLEPGIDKDASYDALLRGVGALEMMWRADPDLRGMGPFTMDAFRMLANLELHARGQGRGSVDAGVVRSLLARAADAPAGVTLSGFAPVHHLVETARELRSLGDLSATVAGVLRLDPSATVGEAQVKRAFWARTKALEWMRQLPDKDAIAVRALHLSAPDPSKHNDLSWLATRAFAAGRNPFNVDELAAYHLEELGAFHPQTRMAPAPAPAPAPASTEGRSAGRNWVSPLRPEEHLDTSALGIMERRPDGSFHRTGEEPAPWLTDGMAPPYVVSTADAGPGRTWLGLPGGRFAVPNTEVAELISRDPDLIGRVLHKTDVVLAVKPADPASGPSPSTPQLSLRLEVAKATSREVWTAKGPSVLSASSVPGRFTVGSTPARTVQSAAADWSGTIPADTVPHGWPIPPAARGAQPSGGASASATRPAPLGPTAPPSGDASLPAPFTGPGPETGRETETLGITDSASFVHGAPDQTRTQSPAADPVPVPERADRLDTLGAHTVFTGAPPADGPDPTTSATSDTRSLTVRAAVPVPAASHRPHIDFVDGRTELDEDQREHIAGLARRIVISGVRDLSAGLRVPLTTVTGYGDGSRLAVGSGPAQRIDGAGRRPAQVVADALREAIRDHLAARPRELAAVLRVRGRELTADDFPIDVRAGEDPAPHPQPGHRRAVVGMRRSSLASAVDRLKLILPQLDLYSPTANDVYTLDRVADLVLHWPVGTPAPSPPAPPRADAALDTDVVPDRLRVLYELVVEAMATGDAASSIATLNAFHLSRQGVFADETRLKSVDGSVRGRNWSGRPGRLVDTTVRQRVPGSDDATPSPTPWPDTPGTPGPFVIGTADGNYWGAGLALPDGRRYHVAADVFSELVGMDPDLSSTDTNSPVALVSVRSGAMGLDLPRMSAFRSGRQVYAHTGRVDLVADTRTAHLHIEVSDQRGSQLHLGTWVLSEPDDWDESERPDMGGDHVRTADNRSVRMSDLESVTIVLDGRPAGRMLMNLSDQANRESTGLDLAGFTEWNDIDPVTYESLGEAHTVQWKGRKPYVLWLHGTPGFAHAVAVNGAPVPLTGPETVRYLKRRPSVRRLGQDDPIVAVICWGAARPGAELGGFSDDAPFVRNRWGTISWLQTVSNDFDRHVFAPDRVHVTGGDATKPVSGVLTTAMGKPGAFDEARPEPKSKQLDDLSRTAGLHDLIADAQDRRETTLQLVRGLRDTFGVRVEDDRDEPVGAYQALLSGLGALEAMRRADAKYAERGPFTHDLLDRITRAHTGQSPLAHARPTPVDVSDVRATLRAAREALDADASADLSSFVTLPSLERALELLAEDARVRDVLRMHPTWPVTGAHRLDALWATVEAVEAVDHHPETESLVRQVLHLPSYETVDVATDGKTLLWTAAAAAAVGRDVHNPVALAAYHLIRNAALGPDSLLRSSTGVPVGRNWSTTALSDRFNIELYTVTDPATGTRSSHLPPWLAPSEPFVLALDPGTEADTVAMPWPDQTTRSIPYDEFAELLRNEPALRQITPVNARVVLVGLDPNSTRKLADILSARRAVGRVVLTSRHSVSLKFDIQRNAHYLAITTAHPDRNKDWKARKPEKRPPGWPPPATTVPPLGPQAVVTAGGPQSAGPDDGAASMAASTAVTGSAPRPVLTPPRPQGLFSAGTRPTVPDGPAADGPPHHWVESRLAEPGVERHVPRLAGDDWAGARTRLSTAELLAVGVALDQNQQAYAALMGGLTPAEAGLSLVQRYRLLRAWSGDDASAVAEIAAALTSASLDDQSQITTPDGTAEPLAPQPAGELMESRA